MKQKEHNGKEYSFIEKRAIHAFDVLKDLQWHSRTDLEAPDESGIRKYGDPSRTVTALEESGFDIERGKMIENGKRMEKYRLRSLEQKLDAMKKRTNISKKMRAQLYERDNFTCVICLNKFEDHMLEPDHKIPIQIEADQIDASDPHWMEKMQTMCKVCNGRKREICKKCKTLNCSICHWSNPTNFGQSVIRITDNNLRKLNIIATKNQLTVQELVNRIIENI